MNLESYQRAEAVKFRLDRLQKDRQAWFESTQASISICKGYSSPVYTVFITEEEFEEIRKIVITRIENDLKYLEEEFNKI